MSLRSALDSVIETLSPAWAYKRARARLQVRAARSAYDAATRTHLREQAGDYGSANARVGMSAVQVRNEARYLDDNLDIVEGGINTLLQNTVGASGIGVEPQPRDANGDVSESLVEQLQNLRADWCRRPEVTREHSWAACSRMAMRHWAVDGESFIQHLFGPQADLRHSGRVPYSIELINAARLPMDYEDATRRILQGIESDRWGRAVAYHFLDADPGEPTAWPGVYYNQNRRRVEAARVSHVKNVKWIGQKRGMPVLTSVITRFADVKDYEESERIAAKIAASMAAFIIKGDPQAFDANANGTDPRRIRFQPGMVFDDLRPGENVGTVDTNRPNTNLEAYRNAQLRAAASGMRISYSSLSRDYGGTYSSQRQELVEQYGAYGVVSAEWIDRGERPCYENMVYMALLSNQLVIPAGFPLERLYDAEYTGPSMPWINPLHEAEAMAAMIENRLMAPQEAIRRRGANPRNVLDMTASWKDRLKEWDLDQPVNPKNPKQTSVSGL